MLENLTEEEKAYEVSKKVSSILRYLGGCKTNAIRWGYEFRYGFSWLEDERKKARNEVKKFKQLWQDNLTLNRMFKEEYKSIILEYKFFYEHYIKAKKNLKKI